MGFWELVERELPKVLDARSSGAALGNIMVLFAASLSVCLPCRLLWFSLLLQQAVGASYQSYLQHECAIAMRRVLNCFFRLGLHFEKEDNLVWSASLSMLLFLAFCS